MKIVVAILIFSQTVFGQSEQENFSLKFYSIGYGSNRSALQPVFKVNGHNFTYTLESAWIDTSNPFPLIKDTICTGQFKQSSVDSIITILEPLWDSVISKSNWKIMSGGSDFLNVSFKSHQTKFELNNAYDPSLVKIVQILNAYIPEEKDRIHVHEKEI